MSKNFKVVIILLAVMALTLGVWIGTRHFNKELPANGEASTIFSPPQDIGTFSLVDTKGRPFNNDSLWGQWTFLFFGFTNCGSICPTEMANLAKLYTILLQDKQNPMPQVVMISVDPDRDTLQKLGAYVTSFNPHFQGATGDKSQINQLASNLSILYTQVVTNKQSGDYSFDHSVPLT